MSSRTKVSKQVKVTQGSRAVTFELSRKGLDIEYQTAGEATVVGFTLKEAAMDALRELLEPSLKEKFGKARDRTRLAREEAEARLTLPPEEFDERFNQDKQPTPPREPDGTPTPEGLTRRADGVEEGMGE